MLPTIVSVSGFSSESGKTHVLCELLRRAPGWEAIKVTRGHYRSCGKDPNACCVSNRLGDQALVVSDPGETRVNGKDTGRYWDAGATNVHWVIATDEQVADGVRLALDRVKGPGVFVEGGSFLRHFDVDYSIMVASPHLSDVKSSAVGALQKMQALIVNSADRRMEIIELIRNRVARRGTTLGELPVYFLTELPEISEQIGRLHEKRLMLQGEPASAPRVPVRD